MKEWKGKGKQHKVQQFEGGVYQTVTHTLLHVCYLELSVVQCSSEVKTWAISTKY